MKPKPQVVCSETLAELPSGHVLRAYHHGDEWSVVLEDPEGSSPNGTWAALAGGPVKSSVVTEAADVLRLSLQALETLMTMPQQKELLHD